MTLDQFETLKQHVIKDTTVNEENASTKSYNVPMLYSKYLNVYSKELLLLNQLGLDRDKVYGAKYHHYKYKYEFQLDSKSEIDTYVKADDDYTTICLKYNQQEVIVKYLETTLKNITSMNFAIKNYVDFTKFKHGIA